jgi:hypothetical protein
MFQGVSASMFSKVLLLVQSSNGGVSEAELVQMLDLKTSAQVR